MDKPTSSQIIDTLGGTAAVAKLCQVKAPSVSDWRKHGIPAARRQFLQLLRPDVFGTAAEGSGVDGREAQPTPGFCATVAVQVDTGMSKRALRARLGFTTDKQLATVLQLPAQVVESWEEERALPAVPEVLRLLGVQAAAPDVAPPPADPDDERIVPVETA
jgi:hypothetical protein